MSKEAILELRKRAQHLVLFYVEDNKNLQEQAKKVFKKIFDNVVVFANAIEALEYFKKHQADIVVADISLPKMDGLEMSRIMKHIEPFTKIVITSAFDDKEYLFRAIDVHVSRYIKKPLSVTSLIEAISKVIDEIEFEGNKNLFQNYIRDIFQHQDTMLILLKEQNILVVNKKCLDFFSQETLDDFREFFLEFDKLLLEHNNFLYNHDDINWLKIVKENSGRLFNVKIADKANNSKHFVLKAYKIPKKDDTFILSFDDITELNLLAIYDKNAMKKEKIKNQKKTIFDILEIIKRNNSTVRIYNSYKGLNISNTGVLGELNNEEISLQTTYLQLRAISINNFLVVESELFPSAVMYDIKKVDFETSTVIAKNCRFLDDKPSEQEFIRVEPEENHRVSVFFEGRKISADCRIIDISVGGAKIMLSLIPPGFKVCNQVIVDMVFSHGTKPVIVNTKAIVKSLSELKREFEIVLTFENDLNIKKLLTEYVANRQMALIREFKKL